MNEKNNIINKREGESSSIMPVEPIVTIEIPANQLKARANGTNSGEQRSANESQEERSSGSVGQNGGGRNRDYHSKVSFLDIDASGLQLPSTGTLIKLVSLVIISFYVFKSCKDGGVVTVEGGPKRNIFKWVDTACALIVALILFRIAKQLIDF